MQGRTLGLGENERSSDLGMVIAVESSTYNYNLPNLIKSLVILSDL